MMTYVKNDLKVKFYHVVITLNKVN